MKCPYCGSDDSRVIDSRDVNDGVRRRRQCLDCSSRFTTYEKRPLSAGTIDRLADDIEAELYHLGRAEVVSSVIGDMVMERLRKLDYIAYIRFASVYRDFTGITDLKQEVDTLVSAGDEVASPGGQPSLLPDDKPRALAGSHRRRRK